MVAVLSNIRKKKEKENMRDRKEPMDNHTTRFVFVTGGVCSSLGKGISVASLGLLLEGRGYRISLIKMDPYINIDPAP
jgi:hypothetical protein